MGICLADIKAIIGHIHYSELHYYAYLIIFQKKQISGTWKRWIITCELLRIQNQIATRFQDTLAILVQGDQYAERREKNYR